MVEKKLIYKAIEMRELALAPYSKYKVGAAVLTDSGDIISAVSYTHLRAHETR